jgi:thioredoxin 1
VKVNVDDDPEIASRYRISGVPTMMFFRDGRPVDQIVGVPPVESLQRKLDQLSAMTSTAMAAN